MEVFIWLERSSIWRPKFWNGREKKGWGSCYSIIELSAHWSQGCTPLTTGWHHLKYRKNIKPHIYSHTNTEPKLFCSCWEGLRSNEHYNIKLLQLFQTGQFCFPQNVLNSNKQKSEKIENSDRGQCHGRWAQYCTIQVVILKKPLTDNFDHSCSWVGQKNRN